MKHKALCFLVFPQDSSSSLCKMMKRYNKDTKYTISGFYSVINIIWDCSGQPYKTGQYC